MKRNALLLSDEALARHLRLVVANEHVATAVVLDHIAEFDQRKLYRAAGYASMFAAAVHKTRAEIERLLDVLVAEEGAAHPDLHRGAGVDDAPQPVGAAFPDDGVARTAEGRLRRGGQADAPGDLLLARPGGRASQHGHPGGRAGAGEPRLRLDGRRAHVKPVVAMVALTAGAAFFGISIALGTSARDGFLFAVGVIVALIFVWSENEYGLLWQIRVSGVAGCHMQGAFYQAC